MVDDGKEVGGWAFSEGRNSLISEPGRVAIAGALGSNMLDFNKRELRGWRHFELAACAIFDGRGERLADMPRDKIYPVQPQLRAKVPCR